MYKKKLISRVINYIFGHLARLSRSRSFRLPTRCPASSHQYFSGSAGRLTSSVSIAFQLTTITSLFFSKQLEIAVVGLQV